MVVRPPLRIACRLLRLWSPVQIVYHCELHGIVGQCSHQNLEVGASPSKMTRVNLAAGAGNLEHVANYSHMQKLQLQTKLSPALKFGHQTVMFQTDSMILKQAISSEKYGLNKLGTSFRKINLQMRVSLNVLWTLFVHGCFIGSGLIETWLSQFS